MKELNTIQKREKLNIVVATDDKGPGGANHEYLIRCSLDGCICDLASIKFQKGARKEENSIHGVIDSDLLEIVRDRLKCFQEGPFSSEYNEKALEHIELALMYMNRRVEDRIERNVLGTYNK
ncbi:ABC transporter ATPase [Clostridium baratii]|uniref:ABC transporter ATPase n=1 Tax=Clostridium baratii TaxID=1561 RepID=UPI0030CBB726